VCVRGVVVRVCMCVRAWCSCACVYVYACVRVSVRVCMCVRACKRRACVCVCVEPLQDCNFHKITLNTKLLRVFHFVIK
jgi:hypothetical protein